MTTRLRVIALVSLSVGCRLAASAATQTISFDQIPNQLLGGSPFPLAARASSGLPVSVTSTTPAVCKTAGTWVMPLSAGPCFITVSQPGNATYSAASSITRNFVVAAPKPSGTLNPGQGGPFALGTSPAAIAAGDFNGDGIPDLISANSGSNNLSVLLGNGSGGFSPAPGSPFAAETNPSALVVGDFNGDGMQDIAVAGTNGSTVTVLLGDGTGRFSPVPGGPFAAGALVRSLAMGDFNSDGIQDLAIANPNGVSVFLGSGTGTFAAAPKSPFTIGTVITAVVVGDFDLDGVQDLAITSSFSNNVSVLLGNGSGDFSASRGSPFSLGSALSPATMAVGDFNGDGNPDLAVACTGSQSVAGGGQNTSPYHVVIFLGTGTGGFYLAPGGPYNTPSAPTSVTVGDWNGDGLPDVALADKLAGTVSIYLGTGGGKLASNELAFLTLGSPSAVLAGDFNGDGLLDLAVARNATGDMTILRGGQASTNSVLGAITGDSSASLSVAVTSADVVFAAPTGSVTFLDGAKTIGTASQTTSPYTLLASNLAVGTHSLSAVYSGDSRNTGSTSNSLTVQIASTLKAQTITFNPPTAITLPATPFALTATATSGLIVTFSSSTPGICTVAGSTLTPIAAGTCTITASQSGDLTWAQAAAVIQSFALKGASQTLPSPTGGIVNAASAGQAPTSVVSIGSYIAIYGTQLAGTGSPFVTTTNLPTAPNGTQLTLGGIPMPLLYAASGQVDAIVPQGLAPNNSYPLVVTTGQLQSLPVMLVVKELQPGIYTVDTSGSGPAIVTDSFTGQLISPANPAKAGEFLTIYATGLGTVFGPNREPAPADGTAAPLTTLYSTEARVTATLGGVVTPVTFSGLTPTLIGLYQVNVRVPAGIAPGSKVPLVIVAESPLFGETFNSNSVTIAVQ